MHKQWFLNQEPAASMNQNPSKPSSPSHTAPSGQQPNNGAQRLRLAPQKGHNLVASSMTPFDSLLFCKLGIPFLGVCYSCNKSRACNHLAFLDGGLAWPPFVGPLVFFWRFGSPMHWDFLGWAFLVLFGFFSLSKKVTCWSYISPKLGLGSHRVIGLKT